MENLDKDPGGGQTLPLVEGHRDEVGQQEAASGSGDTNQDLQIVRLGRVGAFGPSLDGGFGAYD